MNIQCDKTVESDDTRQKNIPIDSQTTFGRGERKREAGIGGGAKGAGEPDSLREDDGEKPREVENPEMGFY